MKMRCGLYKTVFLVVLFFGLTVINSASAEQTLDFAKYDGMITEDGSAINDNWWIISNIYGRDNVQFNDQPSPELMYDNRHVTIVREIDSEKNTLAKIEAAIDEEGNLSFYGGELWEVQDNYVVLHGRYEFQEDTRLVIQPAPRLPRFFQPGEGLSWDLELSSTESHARYKYHRSFTYHGKEMTLPSNAVPGDNSLDGVARISAKETRKTFLNDDIVSHANEVGQAGLAPGKGQVWANVYMNGWMQVESILISYVRSMTTDEVVDWGKGDYPDILQNQDIEMILAALSEIPLATSFKDVSKTSAASQLTLHQKADIIFNWIESQFPDLFSPTPQSTHVDEGLIFRSYNDTESALGIMQNSLYYLDNTGELHNLGAVNDWLNHALSQG